MSPRNDPVYMQVFFDWGIMGLSTFIWLLISTGALAAVVCKTDRMEGFLLLMLALEFALVSISDSMLDYLVYDLYLWFVLGVGMHLNRSRMLGPEEGADMRCVSWRNLAMSRFPMRRRP